MAKINVKSKIELDIKMTLELTLCEARALNEITRYNTRDFLDTFYKHLGKSYLAEHEKGFIQLVETLRESLPSELKKADAYIDAINKIATT